MASQGTIKLGPWGGSLGTPWDFHFGSNAAITDITINYEDVIRSVTLTSIDRTTREKITTTTFGGTGTQSDQISINWPEEYLTSINGTIIDHGGLTVIESLTFHTNKNTYGPYGNTSGSTFEIPMENGEIVGFFGRAGSFLDAVGIYVILS